MKRTTRRVLSFAGIVAIVGLNAGSALGATQHDVRQSDFIAALSDTRSAGHIDFLKEGLHVYTDDNSSNAKAAEYYAPTTDEIPTSGSYDWYGTDNQPGSQVVFDTNSDRSDAGSFNILVGEQVYTSGAGDGDNLTDWWYTGGSSKAATNGITCPSTTGGSGSDCHGTLQQWHDATGMSNAEVYAYGFSLGSGLKGDGVLRSQTYGNDQYVFTDEAAGTPTTPQNTTADFTVTKTDGNATVKFASDPLGPNHSQGDKVTWRVDNKDQRRFSDTMGADETASYRYITPKGYTAKLTVYKNDVLVATINLHN